MEVIRRNTDYALRALVYLAMEPQAVRTAAEISSSQDIPLEFLQKVLQKCVRAGLVISHRGPQGGFSLAKDPREVTVLDVVEIVQGPLTMNQCFVGAKGCLRAETCPLKGRWSKIEADVSQFLRGVTLYDLVRELRDGESDDSGSR